MSDDNLEKLKGDRQKPLLTAADECAPAADYSMLPLLESAMALKTAAGMSPLSPSMDER
jgi:hypothetical protein